MFAERPDRILRHVRRLAATQHAAVSDNQFVQRFMGGNDEAAFVGPVRRHGPLVLAVAAVAVGAVLFAPLAVLRHETEAPLVVAQATGRPVATDKTVRTDRYGDPLPDGAAFRIGTTRLRHKGTLSSPFKHVFFSPDGKSVLASGTAECAVRTWEVATGRALRQYPAGVSGPGFALSADGSLLAVADARELHLYETGSGKERRTLDLSQLDIPLSLLNSTVSLPDSAFSSDGKILTVFHSKGQPLTSRIICWDTLTGKALGVWKTGTNAPLAVSGRSRLVASVGDEEDRTIRLWDPTTGRKVREWEASARIPIHGRCLIFSPDGRNIAVAGDDAMIRVYDAGTGTEVRSWKGRPRNDGSGEPDLPVVGSLVFAPRGDVLASVDRNFVLRLWDVKTGRELRHFEGVSGPVAFSADGRVVAAGGADSRVRLWDAATGRDLSPFPDPGMVEHVAFSPDGRWLAVASDRGMLRLLEADTGRELKRLPGYRLVAVSSDGGSLLVLRQQGDQFGPLCLLDTASGKERVQFRGTNEDDDLGGWDPEGKVLVTINARLNRPVRIWDPATGKKLRELRGKKEWFSACCSADGRVIAVTDQKDTSIRLVAADTGKELRRLTGYSENVSYRGNTERSHFAVGGALIPIVSPDGRWVLAGCDGNSFGLWDVATGKRTLRWDCAELLPHWPEYSPDGKCLALLDPHADPCLVDTATGRVRHRLRWKGGELAFLLHIRNRAFSTDGRLLVAAYDKDTLVLWEVASGRPIRTWPGHGTGELRQMAFSPDGRRLATVGSDGTALVWDVTGLRPDGRWRTRKLTPPEAEQAWRDLGGADPAKAHLALWSLVADPAQALPLLRERLRAIPEADSHRLAGLVSDLDSKDFTVRERASQELAKLDELARTALREARARPMSPEVRRRVQVLLDELDGGVLPAETLRGVRAVEVLEHVGTPEARTMLARLAKGAPPARLTQEARAALERLERRRLGDTP
jgi:WD40 repeat protein